MKNIHCISGLGADQRIFRKLNIAGAEFKPVIWPHFDKHDGLSCYAQKVAAIIPEGKDEVILGLSFGGMLASEIARMRPEAKIIIVSSVKSPAELPPVKGWVKFLGRHGLVPVGLAKYSGNQIMKRFGAYTEEEKALMKSILEDTDTKFANHAVRAMLEWQTTPPPGGILHIHGTSDGMILPDKVLPTYWIKGGSHIMIWNRAGEISDLISKHLST